MSNQIRREDMRGYSDFVDKFKRAKPSDECYTPPEIYGVVRDWACHRYGIEPSAIVRPFYPGGDFEHYSYPAGCVVVDNPPFSILSKIIKFYLDHSIRFFLFAPSLTAFGGKETVMRCNHIICTANIIYDNGAIVNTSFVTNLGDDGNVAESAPELSELIEQANVARLRGPKKELPKYKYPDHVLTAARLQYYSSHGVRFKVHRRDCRHISKLDSQAAAGTRIYGGGLLLSDRAAAERVAAERVVAERAGAIEWELSEREKQVIKSLG